jgi:hypothetical protein
MIQLLVVMNFACFSAYRNSKALKEAGKHKRKFDADFVEWEKNLQNSSVRSVIRKSIPRLV